MKKLGSIFLIIVLAVSILSGCASGSGKANGGKQDTVLEYQSEVGSVNWPELAADLGYLGDLKLNKVSNFTGGPESIQLTATGQTDFGWAFNGAIIKSYAKNVKIQSVVGAYGSDQHTFLGAYKLKGSPIKSAKDFIGKKVSMNILGAHLEFALKDYLRQGGLTEEEIKKVTFVVMPGINAEQALRNKQVDVALLNDLPKDLLLDRGGVEEIFTDIDIYNREFTAGDFFFTHDYIADNPETVEQFTEGVAKAIEWAKTSPREEVVARFEKILKARGEDEMVESLKYWESTGIIAEGGVINDADYDVWIDWLEKSGELKEGKLKAEDLYTNEFNPYAEGKE